MYIRGVGLHIVCAANRYGGIGGHIVCSARHHDKVMNTTVRALKDSGGISGVGEQGFMDQYGDFYTREEALDLIRKSGQPTKGSIADEVELYSESLY